MTNQEILTKAIEKALEKSWDLYDHDKWIWSVVKVQSTSNNWYRVILSIVGKTEVIDAERIIFDHDFARALWPIDDDVHHLDRKYVNPSIGGHYDEQEQVTMQLWQLNLMQMVIADDPIKYLGEHLDD